LERDGLIERTTCDDDRRALFVALTKEGRSRYDDARPTQRRVLREEGSDCLEQRV
jgi:DNA-binding MarR family transcriptional regulator